MKTLFAILLVTGCAGSLSNVSSGYVGCAPSEIAISDDSQGWNQRSWVATCHGKRYFCSGVDSGHGGAAISCKKQEDENR